MRRKGWEMKKISLLCGVFLFSIATPSFAQQYPTKPINLLIANTPAGSVNVSLRMLASHVEKALGQPFVISNNNGGGGSVAFGMVAKQRPDGYHLVAGASTPLVRIPQLRPVPYKFEDFVPILHYGAMDSGLFVRADAPWKTLKEFVEYAKKNPGKVTYGVSGSGTPQHLAMEYISKQEGGIRWTAVPVPGEDNSIPLLGGHVTAGSIGSVYAHHVKSGALRLLASHGERRLKAFPDVPTFRECGYDFINETVMIVAAPKGTPLSIIEKLDDLFRKAMDDPEFVKYMESAGNEVKYRNHEDTKKYLEDAYNRLGKMIKELDIPRESEKK
jgi:tripartite-type tricarboxylate transporter receptor subunit TctC